MTQVKANRASLPAGGGGFQLEQLTIGVFLNDQPAHRMSLGSDRGLHQPLNAQEGWILPQGAEGLCHFDTPLDVVMVGVDARILSEVGVTDPTAIAPQIGSIDPLLLQMTLGADQLEAGSALYRETMQRALAAHVAHLVAPLPDYVRGISDQRLSRALSFIHDNLASDVRLEDMAAEAAMSAYHFARAFKAELGQSPLQYVISARMDAAKLLLKTSQRPISEVAYRVGYADTSRFGRHFKSRVGVTPKAYRDG